MDPRRVYRELVGLEKQLREVLRASPLNARDANALRGRLMAQAQRIADASAPFAASKELEQVLWKPCFYKRIEDFRRRIRKYAAAATDRHVREHFARVSAEFQQFLAEAAAFYAHLRDAFASWLQRRPQQAADARRCRQSLHRCYVFLGDLARYRELHSQRARKNFAAAESFYHRALAVLPESGNPHNQLAVLATYVEAEAVAVYRYCRSLLTAQPFATAEENLALLFERSRQRPLAAPTPAPTASASAKDKSAALKSFLHRLTRMHGILFAQATATATATATRRSTGGGGGFGAANPDPTTTPAYPREMEAALAADLRALLRAGVLGDALLLKLVVVHVFCIERACSSAGSGSSLLQDALGLATLTVRSVLTHVAEALEAPSGGGGEANGHASQGRTTKDPVALALRLLGPVAVFCDYVRGHERVLEQLEQHAAAVVPALATLVNQAKVRQLYAPLLAAEPPTGGAEPALVREQQQRLKERLELRGFAPLEQHAGATWPGDWALASPATGTGPDGGASAVTPLADPQAAQLRAWKLYGFARFLCDGYEGDPLLFQTVDGRFTTSPRSASPGCPRLSLGLLGDGRRTGRAVGEDEDDDFDDEVIVFQPSPALRALSGGLKQRDDVLDTPPALHALASDGAFRLRAPSPIASDEQRRRSVDSQAGGGGGHANGAIGSSLGYPSFHTFSGLDSLSGSGLLAGWGRADGDGDGDGASSNSNRSSSSNVARSGLGLGMGLAASAGGFGAGSNPPGFPSRASSSTDSQSLGAASSKAAAGGGFAPMADLAAVERESALYQRGGSRLRAFLGPPAASSQQHTPAAAPRPPPGFAGAAATSTATSTATATMQWQQPLELHEQQQVYARNPFLTS